MQGFHYRLWPRPALQPDYTSPLTLGYFLASMAIVMGVLTFPPVVQVTGVPARVVLPLTGGYAVWVVSAMFLLRPWARRSWAFHVLVFGDLVMGLSVCMGLVLASRNPMTLLWITFTTYASFDGAMVEIDATVSFLLAHALVPLLAIPIFRAMGADPVQALAGPVIAGGFSAMCYHFLAQRTEMARVLMRARERERQERSAAAMREDRERIARDVHDSVSAALSTAALYGDLATQGKVPATLMPALIRDAGTSARATLADLRAVLNAVDPQAAPGGDLSAELRALGERATAYTKIRFDLRAEGQLGPLLTHALRVTVLRIVQEAIANAVRHSGAATLTVALKVSGGVTRCLELQIADDGSGFDAAVADGRGLRGIPPPRHRARRRGAHRQRPRARDAALRRVAVAIAAGNAVVSDRSFLVVEDDRGLREMIATSLCPDGWQPLTAASGAEALAQLARAREPPAVALVDLGLPDMDGVTLIRADGGGLAVVARRRAHRVHDRAQDLGRAPGRSPRLPLQGRPEPRPRASAG